MPTVAVIRMTLNDLFCDFLIKVSSYKPISSVNVFPKKCRMRAYTGCIPGHRKKLTQEVQEGFLVVYLLSMYFK